MHIRIISRPSGEAPERVRDNWIGCELPFVGVMDGAGVFSRMRGGSGYAVLYSEAIEELRKRNPEAAFYWQGLWQNHWDMSPYVHLIFSPECCEVIPD